MEIFDDLISLYKGSGSFGDPILISTLALMLAGSVMLFTVRLIKKFVFYSIIALVLPNGIGFVGYLEQADSVQEAVVERGEEMADEAEEAIEDQDFDSLSFGLLGSALAFSVGLLGIARLKMRGQKDGAA